MVFTSLKSKMRQELLQHESCLSDSVKQNFLFRLNQLSQTHKTKTMRKRISPTGKWRFLFAIVCFLALLTPGKISAQSSCSTATAVTVDEECFRDSLTMSQSKWYTFTAVNAAVKIKVLNLQPPNGSVTTLEVFSGACSTLYRVADSLEVNPPSDSIVEVVSGLNYGEVYWIRLSRKPHITCPKCSGLTYAKFDLCIKTVESPETVCSCGTLFPYDSTNTCQAICNGGFDLYNGIITGQGKIMRACPWDNAPYTGNPIPTADLYNEAVVNMSVPSNA